MNNQRKIDTQNEAFSPAPLPGAPRIAQPVGGQVAQWHEQINLAFRSGQPIAQPYAEPPLEIFISTLSRWSGPAIFVAALGGLIYGFSGIIL